MTLKTQEMFLESNFLSNDTNITQFHLVVNMTTFDHGMTTFQKLATADFGSNEFLWVELVCGRSFSSYLVRSWEIAKTHKCSDHPSRNPYNIISEFFLLRINSLARFSKFGRSDDSLRFVFFYCLK